MLWFHLNHISIIKIVYKLARTFEVEQVTTTNLSDYGKNLQALFLNL